MVGKELEEFVSENKNDLYGFCLHLTGNVPDAEDLFQDTFLVSLEKKNFQELLQMESAKGFLIGIAVNLWKNRYRKWKRREQIAPRETAEDALLWAKSPERGPEEIAVLRDDLRELREAVNSLPEKYRITILMYYDAGLSVKEIAAALHIRQGTVKSRLSKARTQIRNVLEGAWNEKQNFE